MVGCGLELRADCFQLGHALAQPAKLFRQLRGSGRRHLAFRPIGFVELGEIAGNPLLGLGQAAGELFCGCSSSRAC